MLRPDLVVRQPSPVVQYQDRRAFLAAALLGAFTAACGTEGPLSPITGPILTRIDPTSGEPWGRRLDDLDGVAIYSNGPIGRPRSPGDSGYGERWECVEFVRRYYAVRGIADLPRLGGGRGAVDFWTTRMPSNLRRVSNGTSELPQRGDLIVMSGGSDKKGHVAIVASGRSSEVLARHQNAHDTRLELRVTDKRLGGVIRYTLRNMSGYTTLGWYTTKPEPRTRPEISGIAPQNLRRGTSTQRLALSTVNVGAEVTLFLISPSGSETRINFEDINMTPGGLAFSTKLRTSGTWSVRLKVGSRSSNTLAFQVK